MKKYICPCCENYTFEEKPGNTYQICPVCYWEDDRREYEDEEYDGGANGISLKEARANYKAFGAVSEKMIPHVRKPEEDEMSGIDWRKPDTLPKRSEVPVELTWRLEDIYETVDDWEKDYKEAEILADELSSMAGNAADTAENLLKSLTLYEKIYRIIFRVYGYANMKCDQDTADSEGQMLIKRAQSLEARCSEKMAFLSPEITANKKEVVDSFYSEEAGLEAFRVMLEEEFRTKEHTLTKEMEELLAAAGESMETAHNAFGMLINADLKFPEIKDSDGKSITLSNGRFVPLEMSEDREVRRKAFEALYTKYQEFRNTWAALYDGQVKKLIFYARQRKYESTYVAAVEGANNVSRKVCENLIASVHDNMDKMHRYVRLRKKMLGVDELHMYDVYASMVQDYQVSVTYEEAKKMTLEALKPLGEEYLSVVEKAYNERWIDVVENENKRGGAYSEGVYGVHPYMLLNFNGTLDDVFTLIHEMGHSMHTWYSEKEQGFLNSQYKIFVAEVASTTNEILLLEYLLKNAKSKKEEAYLINHYLESFKGTLYRQTMFAEFEKKTNEMAEEGVPLTADVLSQLYLSLNKEYFGEAMVSDDLIQYEWCRIPHFYYNFYVYQYATSFAASVAIAHRILEEGAPMVERYISFLKSGCTKDPVSLLKIAGVDLSEKTPIDEALKVFEEAIERMEKMEGLSD